MACLFKRNGKGQWRVAYFDWCPTTGKKRRREKCLGTGDRAVAEQEVARLAEKAQQHKREADDLAELRRRGLSDPVSERLAAQNAIPFEQHLGDFEAMLVGRGNTAEHVATTLADEEIADLLSATASAPAFGGLSGSDRVMIYKLALGTGLRAAEIRSLGRESFDLDDIVKATVTVAAAYSKHRREDRQPLHPELAADLKWCISSREDDGPLFPLPKHTAVMLRGDLDRAGIKYRDADGMPHVGFHCLRHTFITRLARSGVAPAVAKKLARHSTIALTIDFYTHTTDADGREALSRLPAIRAGSAAGEERARVAARKAHV